MNCRSPGKLPGPRSAAKRAQRCRGEETGDKIVVATDKSNSMRINTEKDAEGEFKDEYVAADTSNYWSPRMAQAPAPQPSARTTVKRRAIRLPSTRLCFHSKSPPSRASSLPVSQLVPSHRLSNRTRRPRRRKTVKFRNPFFLYHWECCSCDHEDRAVDRAGGGLVRLACLPAAAAARRAHADVEEREFEDDYAAAETSNRRRR